jgi:hypothetical protein
MDEEQTDSSLQQVYLFLFNKRPFSFIRTIPHPNSNALFALCANLFLHPDKYTAKQPNLNIVL